MKYVIVVSQGKWETEAIIFTLSALENGKVDPKDIYACYPVATPKWKTNPEPSARTLDWLRYMGVNVVPFDNELFGQEYTYSNKGYALREVAADTVTLFDTDVFFMSEDQPLELERGYEARLVGPGGGQRFINRDAGHSEDELWVAFNRIFGCESQLSVNRAGEDKPVGGPYPYFNGGMVRAYGTPEFGELYVDTMTRIWTSKDPVLKPHRLNPFLDEISLPITMNRAGGSTFALDMSVFNSPESGLTERTIIWHYHYDFALVGIGREKKEAEIARVLDHPELEAALPENSTIRFWKTDAGMEAWNKHRPEVLSGDEIRRMVSVFKNRGYPRKIPS